MTRSVHSAHKIAWLAKRPAFFVQGSDPVSCFALNTVCAEIRWLSAIGMLNAIKFVAVVGVEMTNEPPCSAFYPAFPIECTCPILKVFDECSFIVAISVFLRAARHIFNVVKIVSRRSVQTCQVVA